MENFFQNHTYKELYFLSWDIKHFLIKKTYRRLLHHGLSKKNGNVSIDEHIVSNAIHKIYDNIFTKKKFDIKKTFMIYMKGAVRNAMVDFFLANQRQTKKLDDFSYEQEDVELRNNGENKIIEKERELNEKDLAIFLKECVLSLTDTQGYVITEKYWNNRSNKELAEEKDCTVQNIIIIHKKAKEKLKELLIEKGFKIEMLGDFFE